MNIQRYLFFGCLSMLAHSFLLSASPRVTTKTVSIPDNNSAISVNVKLASSSTPPKTQQKDNREKKDVAKTQVDKEKPTEIAPNSLVKSTIEKSKKPDVVEAEKKSEPTENVTKKETHKETKKEPSSMAQNQTQIKLVDKPSFAVKPTPIRYPRVARKKGLQGQVIVEVSIGKNGKQLSQTLVQSSGHAVLDNTTLSTIAKWTFNTYELDGTPIVHRVRIPINFKLD